MNETCTEKQLKWFVDMLFEELTKILDKFGYGWNYTLEDILGVELSLDEMREELYTLVMEIFAEDREETKM